MHTTGYIVKDLDASYANYHKLLLVTNTSVIDGQMARLMGQQMDRPTNKESCKHATNEKKK